MINANDLYRSLRFHGLNLAVRGGMIEAWPSCLLTDSLRAIIRENREALIALLACRYCWCETPKPFVAWCWSCDRLKCLRCGGCWEP